MQLVRRMIETSGETPMPKKPSPAFLGRAKHQRRQSCGEAQRCGYALKVLKSVATSIGERGRARPPQVASVLQL